jgi:hypothetical protein
MIVECECSNRGLCIFCTSDNKNTNRKPKRLCAEAVTKRLMRERSEFLMNKKCEDCNQSISHDASPRLVVVLNSNRPRC